MRYITGHQSYKIVIRPSQYMFANGVRIGTTAPLRAVFENGVFDSEAAARSLRWSVEERELVDSFLQQHQDYRRQGGFFPAEEAAQARLPESHVPLDADGCRFTRREGGAAITCGQTTVPGSPWCADHLAHQVAETAERARQEQDNAVTVGPLGAGVPTGEDLVSAGVGPPHVPGVPLANPTE